MGCSCNARGVLHQMMVDYRRRQWHELAILIRQLDEMHRAFGGDCSYHPRRPTTSGYLSLGR